VRLLGVIESPSAHMNLAANQLSSIFFPVFTLYFPPDLEHVYEPLPSRDFCRASTQMPRIYVFLMFLLCTSACILEHYFSCGVSNDRGCRDRVSKIEQTSKALILKTETYQREG
jgi:hypothetical protein